MSMEIHHDRPKIRRRNFIMLVTLKEVLKVAEEKEIAIGAFNAPNLESLQAVMAAAEEMDLPVICLFHGFAWNPHGSAGF